MAYRRGPSTSEGCSTLYASKGPIWGRRAEYPGRHAECIGSAHTVGWLHPESGTKIRILLTPRLTVARITPMTHLLPLLISPRYMPVGIACDTAPGDNPLPMEEYPCRTPPLLTYVRR
jgi:hypothetical protein